MAAANTDKLKKYKSLFSTTLSTGIGTGTGDTITPATVTGLPTDTAITLTIDRVDSGGTATPTKLERITGVISGGNLTSYVRAKDSTTEQAHSAGAVIEMVWNAQDWNDMCDWGLVNHKQDGTHNASFIVSSYINASAVTAGTLAASAVTAGRMNYDAYNRTPVTSTPEAGATDTLDLSTGNEFRITMPAGNITIAISNETSGQKFIISILQDGTGSRTVTWFSTIRWAGGSAPTLTTTASKRDVFGFIVTGTDTYDGFVVGQNI